MLRRRIPVLCAILTGAGQAHGEERTPGLELTWDAPAPCPGRDEIEGDVWRLVGSESPQRRLVAEGHVVQRGDDRWVLTLETELDGMRGERAIEGQSCRSVSDAGVLLLALALNPEIIERAPEAGEPARPAPPDAAAPAEPLVPRSVPAPPAERSRPLLTGSVREFVGVRSGSLPRPGPELGAGLGLRAQRIAVEASLGYGPTQESTLRTNEGVYAAKLELLALSAGAGLWLLRPPVELGPNLGVEMSRVAGRANGDGVEDPEDDTMGWTSVYVGAIVGFRLTSGLWVRLDGNLLLPFTRPEATIEGTGVVNRPDEVAFAFDLGLEQRARLNGRRRE